MGKGGRPAVLDAQKRAQIVAILSVGCSQNVAAQYVGCAPSTILRTAERDPKFAEELGKAKSNAELALVKNIRNAAKKEQYWRAAAWALERGFPEKYASRPPETITFEQAARIISEFAQLVVDSIPAKKRKQIIKQMQAKANFLGIELDVQTDDDDAG